MSVRGARWVLALAAFVLAGPLVLAASELTAEPWLAVLVAPHAAALLAVILVLLAPGDRRAAWGCAGAAGAATAWALFMAGGSEPDLILILAPGPLLALAGGVMLLRQNPKAQESPLPSIDTSDARRP